MKKLKIKTKVKKSEKAKTKDKVKKETKGKNTFTSRFAIKDEVLFCAESNVFIPAVVKGIKFESGLVYYQLHVLASNGDYYLDYVRSTRVANLKMEF